MSIGFVPSTSRVRVPFPPRPAPEPEVADVRVSTPLVFVPPAFEYKHLARDLAEQAPSEAELDALGAAGWELVGVVGDRGSAHFFFKRETQ